MSYEYFDIHSHLYFPDFDKDREEEIEKLKKEKIGTITIGTNFESSQKAILLAEKHKNLFASIGQHPGDLKEDSVFDERFSVLAEHERVVAIGECGLDYFRINTDDTLIKSIQRTVFEYQLDLALSANKPMMLHIRSSKDSMDAYKDSLDILEHHSKISGDSLKGNVHFFAGDMDILKRFLGIGFTVSFTGVITFTKDYDELIRYTPTDMILSETDSPFVAPVPHRGKRCSPLYVKEVVKRLAELKELDEKELKKALISNTLRVFPSIA